MTAHDPRVARIAAQMLLKRPVPRHPLDELNPQRQSDRLVVFTPSGSQVDALLMAAQKVIGRRLASNEAIHRVVSHNPDRKSTRLNSSHRTQSRMPSSA